MSRKTATEYGTAFRVSPAFLLYGDKSQGAAPPPTPAPPAPPSQPEAADDAIEAVLVSYQTLVQWAFGRLGMPGQAKLRAEVLLSIARQHPGIRDLDDDLKRQIADAYRLVFGGDHSNSQ